MDIIKTLLSASLSAILPEWWVPVNPPEKPTSLSAFAQEVCSRLQYEIQILPKEHGKHTPRVLLQRNLADFQANLMTLGDALDDGAAKRTRKALYMLEHLCQWPNSYYQVGATDSGDFSPSWYPSLNMLLTSKEYVREPLRKFFSDFKRKATKQFWTRLSASLDAAGIQDSESTLRGPGRSELRERRNTIETCQDKKDFIDSLHKSLAKYCQCRCEPACDFMAANIRLNCNDKSPHRTDNISKFNLLFQDLHSIQNSQSSCYWRDIEISVCVATATTVTIQENSDDKKPIEYDDPSEESDADGSYYSTIESLELLDELKLCQIITEARESQLQVQLIHSKGELRLKKKCFPLRRFLTNVPSTPLAELLHYSKLTDRNKAILSYLLVESVWQYYDCGWENWSTETVQFMSQRARLNDSSEVVYVNQPFLHAKFDKRMIEETINGLNTANKGSVKRGELDKSQPAVTLSSNSTLFHKYPKLLALGIMLLEIQLGRKLESFETPDIYEKDPSIARHRLASAILEDEFLWPPENAWIVIKEIIEMCIDNRKAKAILKGDTREVRQKIYEQIVVPLRVFILEAWKQKDIEDVDPVTIEKAWKPKGIEDVNPVRFEKATISGNGVAQGRYCRDNEESLLGQLVNSGSTAKSRDKYTIGWVCALPKEQTAAIAMLDEVHPHLQTPRNDPNHYTLGSISGHNVVITCLPKGQTGTNSAAIVATRMNSTFPRIKLSLMVGIGGGMPPNVRLGDVVVSTPIGQFPGVFQWDMGKSKENSTFERTGALNNPPTSFLTALANLETYHEMNEPQMFQYLEQLRVKWPKLAPKYLRSGLLKDVLFEANYNHVNGNYADGEDEEGDQGSCNLCDKSKIVKRKPRDARVHYGLIASGNQVIKDAMFRDQLNKDLGGQVLCVEMEAAGLMNNFPCVVIRGICDYADSHKNKQWQEHAAAVAAAYAKELLQYVQLDD
ncbi:uncharacterized protein TrAFT101_008020 [Trichoderma asperellum]|uniref:uncharacterized protein n=1 Tax=Trichoderma asperellum TaxID=101201 RepID=UPI003331A1ED|nr:hypothetical protein TrAFT101_008020 [Trichoderma asperellum]